MPAAAPALRLRDYQLRIVRACEEANTVVVLPTGSGKTLIAAELIKRRVQPGSPALFLVPTCLLVDQQAKALHSWTGLNVVKYRGGMSLPSSFDVLVATPEAFRIAQRDAAGENSDSCRLQWQMFGVVVFDEVHHVLKKHPYHRLALSLRRWSLSPSPSSSSPPPSAQGGRHYPPHPSGLRVLGLTASYTYAVEDEQLKASLRSMCSDLLVTNTETATSQELKESGYHAVGASAEVVLGSVGAPTPPLPRGVVPVADRKQHEMGPTFFNRLKEGHSTAFTHRLMTCIRAMEKAVSSSELPSFTSPLPPDMTLAPREWGAHAHKLALGGGSKTSASTDGYEAPSARGQPTYLDAVPCPMLAELEYWYEAAKTLVVTWEEAEDEAATILDMGGCRGRPSSASQLGQTWPGSVRQAISAFWADVPDRFLRYEHFKRVLMKKYAQHGGGGDGGGRSGFRGVVFVKKRVTTHVLAHVISIDPVLAPLFSTACLHASSSPATASLSVTKSAAQAHVKAFRDGRVNLLLATDVGEEGMDIPAANCTLRFDAMEHAVSLVQGRGRARQAGSSFVVLRERADRTTADLEATEQRQLRLVQNFKP
ncbi:unnamed protein product, partial [Laminaria digitata]